MATLQATAVEGTLSVDGATTLNDSLTFSTGTSVNSISISVGDPGDDDTLVTEAAISALTTDEISEGTINLYFTDSRAVDAIESLSSLDLSEVTVIRQFITVSSDTLTSGEEFVSVNTDSGPITITLASIDEIEGRVVHVKRRGPNIVTIDTESSATIEDDASASIGTDGDALKLVYNASTTNWEVY